MSDESESRYRCSFDSVADAYERSRPLYAPDALAWIAVRLPLGRVLDLGAGTGKLTRQLVTLGADVVAVEPGDRMRGVLERVVPEARAIAGSAEAIPLPDGAVDAIAVGQAFHWFRHAAALVEMHRVLRSGGGIALLWNRWDVEDPFLRALDELTNELRPKRTESGPSPGEVALATSPLFRDAEEREFRHADRLTAELALERFSSISPVAAAQPAVRERALADARRLVGVGEVDFPMITLVVVADRARADDVTGTTS